MLVHCLGVFPTLSIFLLCLEGKERVERKMNIYHWHTTLTQYRFGSLSLTWSKCYTLCMRVLGKEERRGKGQLYFLEALLHVFRPSGFAWHCCPSLGSSFRSKLAPTGTLGQFYSCSYSAFLSQYQ